MTRDEFINLLKENLEPNAQIDFFVQGRLNDDRRIFTFLNIENVCMNADIDSMDNFNRGGIVFAIKEDILND